MRNSTKNTLIKTLAMVLAMVFMSMSMFMLTGCTDKEAQNAANGAQSTADDALAAADEANKSAANAQNTANDALSQSQSNAAAIDLLPSSEDVAAAIIEILNNYVIGNPDDLVKDSIVGKADYDAATEYIVENDAKFDQLLAKYTDATAVKAINAARIRFQRALTKDAAAKILTDLLAIYPAA